MAKSSQDPERIKVDRSNVEDVKLKTRSTGFDSPADGGVVNGFIRVAEVVILPL